VREHAPQVRRLLGRRARRPAGRQDCRSHARRPSCPAAIMPGGHQAAARTAACGAAGRHARHGRGPPAPGFCWPMERGAAAADIALRGAGAASRRREKGRAAFPQLQARGARMRGAVAAGSGACAPRPRLRRTRECQGRLLTVSTCWSARAGRMPHGGMPWPARGLPGQDEGARPSAQSCLAVCFDSRRLAGRAL